MRGGLLLVLVLASACGPRVDASAPTPAADEPIAAAPATGDFRWTVGDDTHVLRAGAARVGEGGWLELVLVDGELDEPCALASTLDPRNGPPRVRVDVPRGLDSAWPVGLPISPDTLRVQPLSVDVSQIHVQRYALELEAVDAKPGGRVTGRLAWITPKRTELGLAVPRTVGEGRFDVPLCATRSELDALPAARAIAPSGPVKGRTSSGPFASGRAFAILGATSEGVPPHVARLELYPDPLVLCATREEAKGTAVVIGLDVDTSLGERLKTRQPITTAKCDAGKLAWDCFGPQRAFRGFVQLDVAEPRVGGEVRGTLAIEAPNGAGITGTFEAEVCAP